MKSTPGAILPLLLLLQACAQQAAQQQAEALVEVTTRGSFVTADGTQTESPKAIYLSPGQHTLMVRWKTYGPNYLCRFDFEASPGANYEIINKPNLQPLTLYRRYRRNALWSLRLDPLAPTECHEERR